MQFDLVVGLNFEFVCNEIGVGQLKHVHNVRELLNNFFTDDWIDDGNYNFMAIALDFGFGMKNT